MNGTDLTVVWEICRRRIGLVVAASAAASLVAIGLTPHLGMEIRATVTLLIGERPQGIGGVSAGFIEPPAVLEQVILSESVLERVAERAGLPDDASALRKRVSVRTNPAGIVEVRLSASAATQALAAVQAIADEVVRRHAAMLVPLSAPLEKHVGRLRKLDEVQANRAARVAGPLSVRSEPAGGTDAFRYQVHVLASNQIGDARAHVQDLLGQAEMTLAGIRATTIVVPPSVQTPSRWARLGSRAAFAGLTGALLGVALAIWLERGRGTPAGGRA